MASFVTDLYHSVFSDPVLQQESASEQALSTVSDSDTQAVKGLVAEQLASAGKSTGGRQAGKAGADFWGSRQNLPGHMSQTNRANLGAQFGAAHSVMDDQANAQAAGKSQAILSSLSDTYVNTRKAHNEAVKGDATLGHAKAAQAAEIKNSERAGALDASLGFINAAVSSYGAASSYLEANPGKKADLDAVKTKGKNSLSDAKDAGGQALDSLKRGEAPDMGKAMAYAKNRRTDPAANYARPLFQNPLAQYDFEVRR